MITSGFVWLLSSSSIVAVSMASVKNIMYMIHLNYIFTRISYDIPESCVKLFPVKPFTRNNRMHKNCIFKTLSFTELKITNKLYVIVAKTLCPQLLLATVGDEICAIMMI